MELGDKVRIRREELGMSQEDLALKMGYKSRSSINKIETGRPVSQKIIARLASTLNVSVGYLMGWDDVEQKESPTTQTGSEALKDAGYYKLNEDNKAFIDQMIEKLLKAQSGE